MGAQDPHWIEYVAAFGGLAGVALALVAALYAKRSADATDEAVSLARDEVEMTREEHNEFLRQLQARARFRLVPRPIYPQPDKDGVLRSDATTVTMRVEIGLKNHGDRAARETVINVLAPRHLESLRWSGPNGEKLAEANPAPSGETLTDADGHVHDAQYLALILPSVTRRSVYVRYFVFDVELPRDGITSVPVRVTAEADELPDDELEPTEHLMLRVARSNSS
jgi:hypothetical protein